MLIIILIFNFCGELITWAHSLQVF
jgi:hypothetical protein